MKIYHIVISMLVILAILFIFAPKFRRWEQKKSQLEVEYFENLRNYINTSKEDTQLFEKIITLAKKRYNIADVDYLKTLIETDLQNFEAIK